MLIGPVFTRELVLAPRRTRFFLARAGYVGALLLLVWTAWLVLTGTQVVRDIGDLARFGNALFQIIAPLQVALAIFFPALLGAAAVAQEKDRRTMVLLLLTKLRNNELVLGKLMASLLPVLVMLAAAWPLFMLAALLGGVSYGQILRAFCVTLATVVVCGSLGSTIALWREKTFQALALTVLLLVMWLAAWTVVDSGALGRLWWGVPVEAWAGALSPWQAIFEACRPRLSDAGWGPLGLLGPRTGAFLAVAGIGTLLLNAVAILRVRAWNGAGAERIEQREPTGSMMGSAATESTTLGSGTEDRQELSAVAEASARSPRREIATRGTRRVWDNPVIWREMRTWAYGRKMLLIRIVYLAMFALAAFSVWQALSLPPRATTVGPGGPMVALLLLSLVLVNSQAVTALTTERDGRALDLLLVTDLTPKEIIYGKLGGVFYNTKEMVLLPVALCGYLAWSGELSGENFVLLIGTQLVLYAFVAMLGIHAGMTYENSRWAVAVSLGTVFFLFFGVGTCIWMMVVFSGSFQAQFGPFFAFMIGGGIGLYAALGARNPSAAIGVASFACPLATFYALSSFMLGLYIAAALTAVLAYGFATAALLIPAIDEFDVVTGRTTAD